MVWIVHRRAVPLLVVMVTMLCVGLLLPLAEGEVAQRAGPVGEMLALPVPPSRVTQGTVGPWGDSKGGEPQRDVLHPPLLRRV